MIQPCFSARCGPDCLDFRADISELARNQNFIGRPDIGAPIDLGLGIDRAKGILAVEHDDCIGDTFGQTLGKLAAGRDMNRLPRCG